MDAHIIISVIDNSGYFFKRKKTIPHCATINAIPDSSLFLEKNDGLCEYILISSVIPFFMFPQPKKNFLLLITLDLTFLTGKDYICRI